MSNNNKKVNTVYVAMLYVLSNVFVAGLNFITMPIFTNLLSIEEYGMFSNFTAWESILCIIVSFQFHATIPRAKYDYNDNIDRYVLSIVTASNVITVIVWIAFELNKSIWVTVLSMDEKLIRLLLIHLFFYPIFSILQVKNRMYNKYKLFVFLAIFSAILRTLVSIIGIFILQDKFVGRILGYVIPLLIINILLWIDVVIKGKKPSMQCVKYAFPIAVPLVLNALAGNILGTSDRIILTWISGKESTALYSVAYTCSSFITIIWTALNYAWTPWFYDKLHCEDYTKIRKYMKYYFGVFVAIATVILLIIPEILYILGGEKYYEARYILPSIIVGFVFQFVYGICTNVETFEKKTWPIVFGTALAATVNVILNILFIPIYGIYAAAYTTLIGYFLLMVFHYNNVNRLRKYKLIFDVKYFLVFMSLIFIFHLICLYLYQGIIIRYSILIIYIICGTILTFKFKDKILNIINGIK